MEKNYDYYFDYLRRGLCFECIPVEFRDKKMCFEAIFNHRGYIKDIPKEVWGELTNEEKYDWCLNGVKSTSFNIQHIPSDIIDEKMCLIVASGKYSYLLKHIHEHLKTYDVCLAGVSGALTLEHIPEKHKTLELCLKAVRNYGFALKHVPESLKTVEICFEAINKNGNALGYVPDSVLYSERGYDLCLNAVKQIGCALEYVPALYKTEHLCRIAMKEEQHPGLEFVPEEFIAYQDCLEIINNRGGYYLKFTPLKFRDYNMCKEALESCGEAFEYVPEALRTKEFYELALDRVRYDANEREDYNDGVRNDFIEKYGKYDISESE